MGTNLQALWTVQQLQDRLTDARRRRDNEEENRRKRRSKLDDLRKAIALGRDESLRKQADMKAVELDNKSCQELTASLRTKLNVSRNQKEYNALLTEIATTQQRNATAEERWLKLDEEVTALKARLAELEARAKVEEDTFLKADAAAAAKVADFSAKVADLEKQRAALLAPLPPDFRTAFAKLADRYDGAAMSALELNDENDLSFACSSCNMVLTAAMVSSVMSEDEIHNCPTCSRILYYVG